jgi:hypothetical protein
MAKLKNPKAGKLAKIGKVGHGHAARLEGPDLLAARSLLHGRGRGSGATAKVSEHGPNGLHAGQGISGTRTSSGG